MLTPQRAFTAPTFLPQTSSTPQTPTVHIRHASVLYNTLQNRSYGTKTAADEIIEEIQEQYGTARDEFEIASEETEKKTVYAADDRAAAREELEALKKMYEDALEGPEGEEVKRRVGQRIRELDNAVGAMEKSALEE
jgi:hypothetical protein